MIKDIRYSPAMAARELTWAFQRCDTNGMNLQGWRGRQNPEFPLYWVTDSLPWEWWEEEAEGNGWWAGALPSFETSGCQQLLDTF